MRRTNRLQFEQLETRDCPSGLSDTLILSTDAATAGHVKHMLESLIISDTSVGLAAAKSSSLMSFALHHAAPVALTIDNLGDIWVADGNGAVWQITTAGTVTKVFSVAGTMVDIAFGPDGNLWLAVAGTASMPGQVLVVTTTGQVVTSYADPSEAAVQSVGIGPNGDIWSLGANGAINDVAGDYHTNFEQHDLAELTTASGDLYIADRQGYVLEFNATGTLVAQTLLQGEPNGVAASSDGTVWVSSYNAGQGVVYQLNNQGMVIGGPYLLPGADVTSITVASNGNAYVTDLSGKMWRITPIGQITSVTLPKAKLTDVISANGYLWATDASGKVWKVQPF